MTARVWKIGTRRAYAYVEGKEIAQRVLEAAGGGAGSGSRRLPLAEARLLGAMAVYADARGRPFAWQIAFDPARCEAEVRAILDETAPA